jgi:hypothetical protein
VQAAEHLGSESNADPENDCRDQNFFAQQYFAPIFRAAKGSRQDKQHDGRQETQCAHA